MFGVVAAFEFGHKMKNNTPRQFSIDFRLQDYLVPCRDRNTEQRLLKYISKETKMLSMISKIEFECWHIISEQDWNPCKEVLMTYIALVKYKHMKCYKNDRIKKLQKKMFSNLFKCSKEEGIGILNTNMG